MSAAGSKRKSGVPERAVELADLVEARVSGEEDDLAAVEGKVPLNRDCELGRREDDLALWAWLELSATRYVRALCLVLPGALDGEVATPPVHAQNAR